MLTKPAWILAIHISSWEPYVAQSSENKQEDVAQMWHSAVKSGHGKETGKDQGCLRAQWTMVCTISAGRGRRPKVIRTRPGCGGGLPQESAHPATHRGRRGPYNGEATCPDGGGDDADP